MTILPCPGHGKCHGPMKWCFHCGDTGAICDADPMTTPGEWCDQHFCRGCFKGPQKLSDYSCESCTAQEQVESLENDMLRAQERGDEEKVKHFAGLLQNLLRE